MLVQKLDIKFIFYMVYMVIWIQEYTKEGDNENNESAYEKRIRFSVNVWPDNIIISNQMEAYACIKHNENPVALVALSRLFVLINDKMTELM